MRQGVGVKPKRVYLSAVRPADNIRGRQKAENRVRVTCPASLLRRSDFGAFYNVGAVVDCHGDTPLRRDLARIHVIEHGTGDGNKRAVTWRGCECAGIVDGIIRSGHKPCVVHITV